MSVNARLLVSAAAMTAALAGSAQGAFFTGGSLVILEAQGTYATGTSGPINSLASSVSLREFAPGWGLTGVQANMPSTGGGSKLTIAGSATSEGQLSLSFDGTQLVCAGYNAVFGQSGPNAGSSIATSTTANVNRAVGSVNVMSGVATVNLITDAYSTNNMRSAATITGATYLMTGSNGGLRSVTPPATTTTLLNTNTTNLRVVNYFDRNGDNTPEVYVSASSGSFQGVGILNTSTNTIDLLPGFPTAAGPSPYDFQFAGANVLYVADDRSAAAGGLQRWDFDGTNWILSYTINAGLPAGSQGIRSLTMDDTGRLWAITASTSAGSPTSLVTIVDTGAGSSFVPVATGASGTVWRGVQWLVPAPGSGVLLGLAALGAARRRRS